jgi:DNA-binding CsgD family transcriptional regulator/tetratricopeptide (TPR) repeat protein
MVVSMPVPFCGRDAQLAALSERLDRTCGGAGTVVLVEGDAGMGKSRLLDEAVAVARRRGFRIGIGVADPGDGMVELATLMAALFDGPEPIGDRAELPDSRTLPEQRYWVLQDLQSLLERAARQAPLLICLDDLQWTDGGTAAALRALPNRLATVPVAWILAFRPSPGSRQLKSALGYLEHNGAQKMVLDPLDEGAVRRLTASIVQAEPDTGLLKMADRAGGNPFFLVEMLSGLKEEQLVRIESGRAGLAETRLPRRAGETMRWRLDQMSELAHQVAAVATALGRRFPLDDLTAMLERPPSALMGPVEEMLQAGLFVESDTMLAFRHDLILEAVRASLPRPVSRALDRQAATVLMARGAVPLEVAARLAASAEPGDEVAITTLEKAADTLETTDPGAAADLSRRALDLAPRDHRLRRALVAKTAVRLHAAARGDEAKAFADTVLRQALPPEEEADFRLIIAAMFTLSPDIRADSCHKGLALPDISTYLRSLLFANLLHNLVTAGRLDEARAVLPEAKTAAGRSGDACSRFVLELAESGLEYADGRFARALELVERAQRSGRVAADEAGLSPQYWRIGQARRQLTTQWLCDALTVVDRLEESLEISTGSITAAQHERQAWALNIFETGRARQWLQMGRLTDAGAALAKLFTSDLAHQVVSVLDAAGVVALGRVAIHTGDRNLARQAGDSAQVMLGRDTPSVRRHAAWLLAMQAMADGDPLRARQYLCVLGEDARTSVLPLFPMDITDEVQLIRIALAADDKVLAGHAADAVRRRCELNPDVRSLKAAAAQATGLLNHSEKDLAEAVEQYEEGPRPLALASALEDLGRVALDDGGTDRGVDAFSRALVLYAGTGASWDAGRVRRRLWSVGVRRRLVPARRPDNGWAALTDSELAVARLVAQGLSNREVAEHLFLSPHTVSGHLRHVFAKLGVNSRVDLARIAAGHEAGR